MPCVAVRTRGRYPYTNILMIDAAATAATASPCWPSCSPTSRHVRPISGQAALYTHLPACGPNWPCWPRRSPAGSRGQNRNIRMMNVHVASPRSSRLRTASYPDVLQVGAQECRLPRGLEMLRCVCSAICQTSVGVSDQEMIRRRISTNDQTAVTNGDHDGGQMQPGKDAQGRFCRGNKYGCGNA